MKSTVLQQLQSNKGKVTWLASYPKSGNTWVRVFLTALISEGNFSINNLIGDSYFPSKPLFEELTDLQPDYLTDEEVKSLRYELYSHIVNSNRVDRMLFVKLHDLYDDFIRKCIAATPLSKIVYIIRNPLSIAASFANHLNQSVDETIEIMNDHKFKLAASGSSFLFPQLLSSWSSHVQSWFSQENDVYLIKYEDMIEKPFETFSSLTVFLGLNVGDDDIKKAIASANINQLKEQEAIKGFREKFLQSDVFFRKGHKDSWKNELSTLQIERIISQHELTIRKYGYM